MAFYGRAERLSIKRENRADEFPAAMEKE